VTIELGRGADRRCARAAVVGFGLADRPVRLAAAERALEGAAPGAEAARRAAEAAGVDADPPGDVHGSAEYRRHLAGVLAETALLQALSRAGAGPRAAGAVP
jgi:carbon-monoxide dehydrogenase medium subunit